MVLARGTSKKEGLVMELTFAERVERLRPRTQCGPNFSRGVSEFLSDAIHCFRLGNLDAAEHYLLIAEVHGGLIDEDAFYKRDPFGHKRGEAR
jgi:hypothetical protein